MKEGKEYISHRGQYHVINLSLKSAQQPTFELAFKCIKDEIANEFRRHSYILESEKLKNQKKEYEKIVRKDNKEELYVTSLKFYIAMLISLKIIYLNYPLRILK